MLTLCVGWMVENVVISPSYFSKPIFPARDRVKCLSLSCVPLSDLTCVPSLRHQYSHNRLTILHICRQTVVRSIWCTYMRTGIQTPQSPCKSPICSVNICNSSTPTGWWEIETGVPCPVRLCRQWKNSKGSLSQAKHHWGPVPMAVFWPLHKCVDTHDHIHIHECTCVYIYTSTHLCT